MKAALPLLCAFIVVSKVEAKTRYVIIPVPAALPNDPPDPFYDSNYAKAVRVLSPDVGDQRRIPIGEKLADMSDARMSEGARISEEISSAPGKGTAITIAPGSMYRVSSSKPFKACDIVASRGAFPNCAIDDDGDGKFDRALVNSAGSGKPLAAPVAYTLADVIMPPSKPGFSRTLIYQGYSDSVLRISYREFSNDYARPAFTEELQLPLSKSFPQQFAVKGLVITVVSLDGMGLIYRIDSADPSAGW